MDYPFDSPDSFGEEQDKGNKYPAISKTADPSALMTFYFEPLDHFSTLFVPGTNKEIFPWVFDELFNAQGIASVFVLIFKKTQPWKMN